MRTWGSLVVTLLLALLSAACRAQGLSEEPGSGGQDADTTEETKLTSTLPVESLEVLETLGTLVTPTYSEPPEEDSVQLGLMLMVLIPLILLTVLLLVVVFFVSYHKRQRTKEEPSSQGSQSVFQTHELGSENLKAPIFEEDTPSVMEIEMEELDKWMNNMNKNADHECLPTVKEEKESNHSPSDNES